VFAESLAHLAGGGAHLCSPPTSLGARAGRSCFVAADIAALAGDHATSAAQLLGRWLRRRGDDDVAFSPGDDDESCGEDRRRLGDFVATIDRLESGQIHVLDADKELEAADPATRCLARHDEGQYRIPEIAAAAAPFSARPNAIRSYYEWHERARAAVALAPVQKEQDWQGIALLCELYAQHFLQDALAAGRMVTPRHRLEDSVAFANRSRQDRDGVRVLLPPLLCRSVAADDPTPGRALAARCEAHPAHALVFGDHTLRLEGEPRPPDDVTFDLAVTVSAASLRDLFAATDESERASEPCARALAALPANENAVHWLDSAWDSPACAPAQLGNGHGEHGALTIIALLPGPLDPSPLYDLSGGTVWQAATEVGLTYVGVGVGLSWLTRPFRGDDQLAVGVHFFSALDRSASGASLYSEYLTGKLLLGAGFTAVGQSVDVADSGGTTTEVNLCALPFARLGIDLRMFDRRLATAFYASAGPAFCQSKRVSFDVLVGLRLGLKSDERGQR
jgi:hypothetical protein